VIELQLTRRKSADFDLTVYCSWNIALELCLAIGGEQFVVSGGRLAASG
jgi:hypothetical protein